MKATRTNKSMSIQLQEGVLTDGSRIYDVKISRDGQSVSIPCDNEKSAKELFYFLFDGSEKCHFLI